MATMIVLSAVVKNLRYCFTEDRLYSQLITEDVKSLLDRLWRLVNDGEAIYMYMRDENFTKQVRKLEKILYRIEDIVESREVERHKISTRRSVKQLMAEKIAGATSKGGANSKFQAELKSLKNQISEISNLYPNLAQEASQGSSSPRDNVGGPSLSRTSTMVAEQWDGEHIIRMEHVEKELLSHLTGGSRRVEVVSICGMGGIGKTTLAKALYSNPIVRERFDVSAWVNVSQEFRTRDIFLSILNQLSPFDSDSLARRDDMVLAEEVYRCLKGRRWLVVLDDVWSTDAWESIKFVFPDDENCSRILVTTRIREVALQASREEQIHDMGLLNEDQSWELFKIRAQLTDSISDLQREQIANKIAIQTSGLPLGIVVLAGILKSTSSDQLMSLLQNFEISKTRAPEALTRSMGLSYNGLPSALKPCLLYMGTFPEGSKIEADTMCQLWIAEGLASTMELAGNYFDELASRNLVQLAEEEMSTHKSFRHGCLHGLVRDTCVSKAKEEEFLEIGKLGHADQPKDSVFRLAIHLDKHEKMDMHPNLRFDLLRSLLLFSTCHQYGEELIRSSAIPDLSNLKWIRILHFDGVDFTGGTLPLGVENSVLLRHLSLRDCYLEELPPYISKFIFLITLDIRVKKRCKVIIPDVLCKLQKLRHLYLPLKFQTPDHNKLQLNGLEDLEILENFDAGICNADDIVKLTRLRHLAVSSEGNLEDLEQIFKCIELNENHLSKTSIDIRNFESYTGERLAFIKKLLSCGVLHILRLEGRIGKIPKLDAAHASFIEIYLNGSELEDDPMKILDGLPNLRILVLECEAYIGEEMCCSDIGFPKLRSLKLSKLYNLKSWEMKKDAMPNLSTLTIENCRKMEKLPKELGRINALRKVKINMMSQEFVERLREAVDGNTNCNIEFEGWLLKTNIPSSTGTSDVASTSARPPPNK